jgi:hypothetical protein
MKIIGYHNSDIPPERNFLDGVVNYSEIKDTDADFVIDVTHVDLLLDPRKFLSKNLLIGGYYSDFIDNNGNLCIHGLFPSIRTTYPGLLYNVQVIASIRSNDILSEIAKTHIISYIPEPIVKIII